MSMLARARAVGGQAVKSGGRAMANRMMNRQGGGGGVPGRQGGDQGGGRKGGSLAVRPKTTIVPAKEMKSLQLGPSGSGIKGDPLRSIYNNVMQIEKILQGTLAAEKDQLDQQRRSQQRSDRTQQEQRLEAKPKIDKKKMKMKKSSASKGLLGSIMDFIGNIILGFFVYRLYQHLPKLLNMAKMIGPVIEFITDIGIGLVDGIATFIDWGYKLYDGTKGLLKKIGGDGLSNAFEGIVSVVNGVITALAFVLGAKFLGPFGFGGRKGGINPKTGIRGRGAGRTPTTSSQAARRYAEKYGRDAAVKRFGEEGVRSLGGKYARSGFTNAARKGAVAVLGKGGTKAVLKFVRPFLKRLPLIGALIDFGLSVAMGEPLGRAAFKAIGAGVLGAIGTGFGGPIGAILGGMAGDWAGGKLYDIFFGNDKGSGNKSYNTGGRVNLSKGPRRGFAKTTIAKQERVLRKTPSYDKIEIPTEAPDEIKTGENKDRAWWDFLGWAGTGGQETLKLGPSGKKLAVRVGKIGNELGKDDYFGPILSLTSKIILGEKPDAQEYKNVGYGINLLIGDGVTKGKIARGVRGYAEGGEVQSAMAGVDVSKWVTDTFKKEISSAIKKQYEDLGSKSTDGTPQNPPGPGGGDPVNINASGMGAQGNFGPKTKAFLDAIAFAEGTFHQKNTGYNTHFAFDQTADLSAHPAIIKSGGKYRSDAFGRYQFMSPTWAGLGGAVNPHDGKPFKSGMDMSPANQDKGAVILILRRLNAAGIKATTAEELEKLLEKEGISKRIAAAMSGEWASFPNTAGVSAYGQPVKKLTRIQEFYAARSGARAAEVSSSSTAAAAGQGLTNLSSGTGGVHEKSGRGTKLAGDLGRYIYQTLNTPRDFSQASEHPDFGGSFTRSYRSWHNVDRAIDIGGYWPQDQTKILAKVQEFNRKNNAKPVELLYGKPGTPKAGTHGDHVHVAYAKGGMTLDGPHLATLGEKGKEIVIDNDSSVSKATPMLLAINKAKDEKGVMDAIRAYAPYDARSEQLIIVEADSPTDMMQGSSQNIMVSQSSGGSNYNSSFEFLDYQG